MSDDDEDKLRKAVQDFKSGLTVVPDDDPQALAEKAPKDWRPTRLEWAGVPKKHRRQVLAGLKDCEALRHARAFMEAPPERWSILVLGGPRGVGKTQAAAWALGEVSSGRFLKSDELSRIGAYNKEAQDKLKQPELLVVDDLGVEYADRKGFLFALVDALIDTRYADERRTIITTNMRAKDYEAIVDGKTVKIEGFASRYGERVADRIREAGRFVELKGRSFRGRQ